MIIWEISYKEELEYIRGNCYRVILKIIRLFGIKLYKKHLVLFDGSPPNNNADSEHSIGY